MSRAWIAVAEVVAEVRSPSIQDIDVHQKVPAHMQAAERGKLSRQLLRNSRCWKLSALDQPDNLKDPGWKL